MNRKILEKPRSKVFLETVFSKSADQLPRHLHIPLTVMAAFILGDWYLPPDEHLLLQSLKSKMKEEKNSGRMNENQR